jgi:hypothetical protein
MLEFVLICIFLVICFGVVVELLINRGKLKRLDTYSYKPVFRVAIFGVSISIGLTLLVYYFTQSLEASATLGLFLLACVGAGCIKTLLLEYQTKRRGGTKL